MITHHEHPNWASLLAFMRQQLAGCHNLILTESTKARQTFDQRLVHTKSQGLCSSLTGCLQRVERNVQLTEAMCTAALAALEAGDEHLQHDFAQLAAITPRCVETESIQEYGREVLAGQTIVEAVTIFQGAIGLGELLIVLLGHEEGMKFEVTAIRELRQLLTANEILDTMKVLWAVITRTLRPDEDADELLKSLEEFQNLMDAWLNVAELIGKGSPFIEATRVAFQPWLK